MTISPSMQSSTTPMSAQRAGQRCDAVIDVGEVAGQSAILRDQATTPLKLICPSRESSASWIYMSSYGGGMVAGDEVNLDVTVGENAALVLTTQASNKVYHRVGTLGATQRIHARVASKATLYLAPDPLVCYEDARYLQEQVIELEDDTAGLVLVDWFTAGRVAMGERWVFDEYDSRNEIHVAGKVMARDRLCLHAHAHGLAHSVMATSDMNCMATAMIVGKRFEAPMHELHQAVAQRPVQISDEVCSSLSPMSWGWVWRVAGRRADQVGRVLGEGLEFVKSEIGAGLWERKW